MDLRFLEPAYLFALLALPLLWWAPTRLRDLRHGLLRALAFAAVLAALAHPLWIRADRAEHHVFVLDTSASVDSARRREAEDLLAGLLRALPGEARASLILVGEGEPGSALPLTRFAQPPIRVPRSSLPAALGEAGRRIPASARGAVTYLGDGASTDLRWGSAVAKLTARGLPVHVVPLERAPFGVVPVGLSALAELRAGHTARLVADVVSDQGAQSVSGELRGPAGVLASIEAEVVGDRGALRFEFVPDTAGFLPLTLALGEGASADPSAARWTRTFAVQDELSVLYLGERVDKAQVRLSELLGPGFHLEAPAQLETIRGELDRFDLVFLDDRPAESLPAGFEDALLEAIRERGTGLFYSGGKGAFGPGGYHQAPLAEALPVESLQKEEKRDPSTTLAIIIDTSGSMAGMRVTLAKEVARLAMRRLLPHDKVGIVEFYGAKRWAAPIQPASNLIELQRALNRLDAGGGTVILPAIEEAYYAMQNVETRYKHVLILTDGGVETGAFEPLLRKMAAKGINVSTVLVGGDAHSEFLVSLANWGKGRFYSVPNRFNLPEILLKQPATAQLPSYRPGSHPLRARGGEGWWGSADPAEAPPLAGFVETRARPGARVLLETEIGAHPILASWRYGLGRVTTFASEPAGPGTASWSEWGGYGPLLARLLTRTAREERTPFEFRVERAGAELRVEALARVPDAGRPRVRLLAEDGSTERELLFRERAPGAFTAALAFDPAREARLLAGAAQAGRGGVERLVSSAREDRLPELQVDPLRAIDPESLAAATGGAVLSPRAGTAEPLRTGGAGSARTLFDLRPWCLLFALLAFLLEIVHRRLDRGGSVAS